MKPIMNEKRLIAAYVAYRTDSPEPVFFLQKRDMQAPTNPGKFSLFGGGIEEGEAPEAGALREIQEELNYVPLHLQHFTHLETATRIVDVFIEKVDSDFEKKITVQEGEYGKFFACEEIKNSSELSFIARIILCELDAWLRKVRI